MKKLLVLFLGPLLFTAWGCGKDESPVVVPRSPTNPVLMPGGFPKGFRPPPALKKKVEEQNKELQEQYKERDEDK